MEHATAERLRGLKAALERKVASARRQAAEDGGHVNVAGRVNAVVVRNIGRPGSVQTTTARQRIRIRQVGHGSTDEQSEATS